MAPTFPCSFLTVYYPAPRHFTYLVHSLLLLSLRSHPPHTRVCRHRMMLLDKNEIIKDTHFGFAFLVQQYLTPGPSKHGVCVWSLPLMVAQRLQQARLITYARAPTPTGTCTTDRFHHQEQHLRKGPRTGSCVVSLRQGTSPRVALLDGGFCLRCRRCAAFQTGCDS